MNLVEYITACPLCNQSCNDNEFHLDSITCSFKFPTHSNGFISHSISAYYYTPNNILKSIWFYIREYTLSLHFDSNKTVLKFATGKYIVFPLDSLNIEFSIPSLLDFIKTYEIFQ